MIYARQPTDEERRELERMVRQEVGRVSRRAQMVLLSIRHKKVPEIAGFFGVCEPTVRFWLRRYDAEGPAGLYDRERSGRPHKITQEVKDTILQLMQSGPEREGYGATFWTVADGLADDRVEDLQEDQDGILWIATLGGLSRFDGSRFRNFTIADGLPSTPVRK